MLSAGQLTELIDAVIAGMEQAQHSTPANLTRNDVFEVTLRWRLYRHAGVDAAATEPFERIIQDLPGARPALREPNALCETLRSTAAADRLSRKQRMLALLPKTSKAPTLKHCRTLLQLDLINEADDRAAGLSTEDYGRYRVIRARHFGDGLLALRLQQAQTGIVPAELAHLKPVPDAPMVPDSANANERDIGAYIRSMDALDRWDKALAFGWQCRNRVRHSSYLSGLCLGFWRVFQLIDPDWRSKAGLTDDWINVFAEPADMPDDTPDIRRVIADLALDRSLLHWARRRFPVCPSVVGSSRKRALMAEAIDLITEANLPGKIHEAAAKEGFFTQSVEPIRSRDFSVLDEDIKVVDVGENLKHLLAGSAANGSGVLLFGSHHGVRGLKACVLPAVCAAAGKPTVMAVRMTLDAYTDGTLDEVVWTSGDGTPLTASNRRAKNEDQIRLLMGTLRGGGAALLSPDAPLNPAKNRAWVPWFLRPYYLPVFPASLALSTHASLVYALTWFDDKNRLCADCEPVAAPPNQGSLEVRSIWATQRVARAALAFHRRTKAPLDPGALQKSLGVPSIRAPRVTGQTEDRSCLSNWIWSTDAGDARPALVQDQNNLTRGELALAARKVANLLQGARDAAPDHHESDRRFSDQFRVMAVLSKGATALSVSLAAHATGSLLSMNQSDVPPETIALRAREFQPHLVIAEANAWTAAVACQPSLANLSVLICGDGADKAALDDILTAILPSDVPDAPHPGEPGQIFYTSGSTGAPKGIVVPHGALSGCGGFDRAGLCAAGDTVCYTTRWDAVGLLDLMACLRGGAHLAVPPDGFLVNPPKLWGWLNACSVTVLSAPVTIWRSLSAMAARPNARTSLTKGTIWGERLPYAVYESLKAALSDVEFSVEFGASESSYIASGPLAAVDFSRIVGSPGGKLVADNKATLGANGKLSLTSPSVCLGVFGELMKENAPVPVGRWPYTVHGLDAVAIDDRGRVDVLGRPDEIVKIAARRVPLAHVETLANAAVPGSRSAVFSFDRDDGTTWLGLSVETRMALTNAEEADLFQTICANITNGLFDAAKPAKILFYEAFPMLPSGKLDRVSLRRDFVNAKDIPTPVASDGGAQNGAAVEDTVTAALAQWARSRNLFRGSFEPDARLPDFTSLEIMELFLLVEELTAAMDHDTLPLERLSTWGGLRDYIQRRRPN